MREYFVPLLPIGQALLPLCVRQRNFAVSNNIHPPRELDIVGSRPLVEHRRQPAVALLHNYLAASQIAAQILVHPSWFSKLLKLLSMRPFCIA